MNIAEYREVVLEQTKEFEVDRAIKTIKSWLKEYVKATGLRKAVLGISGGKDSTIVAKLLVDVLGKENVVGLLMPNGEQKDISDSLRVVELLDIKYEVLNIKEVFDAFTFMMAGTANYISDEARINIAPRIRMTTLYTYGQTNGCRVAGTGNLSERTVGYTTKFGDNASDFNIIGGFTSLEVMRIGEELGLPLDLVYKTPADGLSGQSDEERLGVTYVELHKYLRGKRKELSVETLTKINKMAGYSMHKQDVVPIVHW